MAKRPKKKVLDKTRALRRTKNQPLDEMPVAGGGILDRRLVLKGGALFSAAALPEKRKRHPQAAR